MLSPLAGGSQHYSKCTNILPCCQGYIAATDVSCRKCATDTTEKFYVYL